MKIAVTGANGQLGNCLQQLAKAYPHHSFLFFSSEDLNITDAVAVQQKLQTEKPNALINAAAYTAVDKAETEPEKAYAVNAEGTGNLAAACAVQQIRFLHVSTDYVFDGNATQPYCETDAVNPQGIYGKSKLAGEKKAMQANPETIIVRTSWVYSEHGNNFVKTMLRLMKTKPSLGVVNDQTGCPTYAPDLAEMLIQLAGKPDVQAGIYHYANAGAITWYNFAVAIRAFAGLHTDIKPITTAEFPTPAKRPSWSVLDCSKLLAVAGIAQKPWEQRLQQCVSILLEQKQQ